MPAAAVVTLFMTGVAEVLEKLGPVHSKEMFPVRFVVAVSRNCWVLQSAPLLVAVGVGGVVGSVSSNGPTMFEVHPFRSTLMLE